MSMNRRLLGRYGAALLIVCSLTVFSAVAKPKIQIDNFGRINQNYYRGAQPNDTDYRDLAALGVRTVIDLTRDGRADEQRLVERSGMKFFRIPMTTSERPSEAAVTQFLK